jgi:hypothetical protein
MLTFCNPLAFLSFFLLAQLCFSGASFGQVGKIKRTISFSGGMGVTYIRAIDIVNYLNQYTSVYEKLDNFSSAVEFFAAPEYSLNDDFSLKLEYSYLLKSYSIANPSSGNFQFEYADHMPTALLLYVLDGDGFYVKLGGGLGYHFGKFTQLFPNSSTEERFTGRGLGFKIEAVGNTAFGESLYGVIGADARLDLIGRLTDDTGKNLEIRRPQGSAAPVRLRFVSIGIKFGLIYYF